MSDSQPLELGTVVTRSSGIVSAEIDDEVAMLDIERGICFGMNKVATRVWDLVREPVRVSDICSKLLAEYDVGQADCERQILDLLEELRTEGLVVTVDR
jgi:hypothetical protein